MLVIDGNEMKRAWTKGAKWATAEIINRLISVNWVARRMRPKGQLDPEHPISRALLICLDNLGDAVMVTPAIQAMKEDFPQCKLTVLTRPVNVGVFLYNPSVDEILTDEAPWWSTKPLLNFLKPTYWLRLLGTILQIRRKRFDVIMDLRGDLRHLLLFGVATRPRILLSYGRTGGQCLLSAQIPYDPEMHEIDKKLAILKPLGGNAARRHPKIWLLPVEIESARRRIADLLSADEAPVILVDPGGKPVQQWPPERFAEVVRNLSLATGTPVLLSVAPAYLPLAKEVVRRAGPEAAHLVADLDVRQFIALLAACDLVISCDTGAAHIASAVGTRTVTLFGPTDFGRFWHGTDGSQVVRSPRNCCSRELHLKCIEEGYGLSGACMLDISSASVLETVHTALRATKESRFISDLEYGHADTSEIARS
jgi:ADP-heptose:LPS heptosyltransferase